MRRRDKVGREKLRTSRNDLETKGLEDIAQGIGQARGNAKDTLQRAASGIKTGAEAVGGVLSRLTGGVVRRAAKGADKIGQNLGSTYGEPLMAQAVPTPPIAKLMMARDLGKFIDQLKAGDDADKELAVRIEGPYGIWLRKQDKVTATPKPKSKSIKRKAKVMPETEPMIPIDKPTRSRKRAAS